MTDESVTSPISGRDHCQRFPTIAIYGYNATWKRSKIFNSVIYIELKEGANTIHVLVFVMEN